MAIVIVIAVIALAAYGVVVLTDFMCARGYTPPKPMPPMPTPPLMAIADPVTIRALYSCNGCGLKNIAVDVPARVDEDVVAWMDGTVQLLSVDHRRRAPLCTARSMQEIKIPIQGADRVGGPALQ